MTLQEVYARAREHNDIGQAGVDLQAKLSWARRCRLEPFKKLAATLKVYLPPAATRLLAGDVGRQINAIR